MYVVKKNWHILLNIDPDTRKNYQKLVRKVMKFNSDDSKIVAPIKFPELFKLLKDMKNINIEVY